MTEIEFLKNTTDKETLESYPAGDIRKFADKRAQEFIDAGVAKKLSQTLTTKEEKKFE